MPYLNFTLGGRLASESRDSIGSAGARRHRLAPLSEQLPLRRQLRLLLPVRRPPEPLRVQAQRVADGPPLPLGQRGEEVLLGAAEGPGDERPLLAEQRLHPLAE